MVKLKQKLNDQLPDNNFDIDKFCLDLLKDGNLKILKPEFKLNLPCHKIDLNNIFDEPQKHLLSLKDEGDDLTVESYLSITWQEDLSFTIIGTIYPFIAHYGVLSLD